MEGDAPVERYLSSRIAIPAYATAQAALLDPFRKDYRRDDNPSCELRELKFRKTRKQVCHAYLRDEEDEENGVIDPLLRLEPLSRIWVLLVSAIPIPSLWLSESALWRIVWRVVRGRTRYWSANGLVRVWWYSRWVPPGHGR